MRKLHLLIICAVVLAGLPFFSTRLMAERVILDTLTTAQEDGCGTIRVAFNFPVQYIKHFPYSSGNDLRIKLKPIITDPADQKALFTRETIQLPPGSLSELKEVSYEGNVEGGPFLSIWFQNRVNFKVSQGKDFRSFVINVSGVDDKRPCPPATAPPSRAH